MIIAAPAARPMTVLRIVLTPVLLEKPSLPRKTQQFRWRCRVRRSVSEVEAKVPGKGLAAVLAPAHYEASLLRMAALLHRNSCQAKLKVRARAARSVLVSVKVALATCDSGTATGSIGCRSQRSSGMLGQESFEIAWAARLRWGAVAPCRRRGISQTTPKNDKGRAPAGCA